MPEVTWGTQHVCFSHARSSHNLMTDTEWQEYFLQLHFFIPPDVSLPLFPPTPSDTMMIDSFLELG